MGVIDVLDRQHQQPVGKGVRDAADSVGSRPREAAFYGLVSQHLDRAYRLAAVVMHNPTEAQDVVHDAFVTAWCKYDSLRDPERLEAWFDRIVVNTCRDRMRHASRLQILDLSAAPEPVGGDPVAAVTDEIVIRRALGRLKPDDRLVLALRFHRDMKVDDIAQIMDIRPRAASSRLHRALERLRLMLEEDSREVGP